MDSHRVMDKWLVVLAGVLGCAAGAGVVSTYVFGVFVKAIAAEYGWGRSETTSSITCFYLASGIGSLCLGSLLARFNIRMVTILFVLLFACAVAGVALLPKSVVLFCLLFAAMGFFGAAATAMPYAIAIAAWFDRWRGLAMAIAVAGTALSGTFMSTYANWLMGRYGWRGGYVGVGLFVGLVALIGLVFFFRNPPASAEAGERGPSLIGIARRDRTFWIIAGPIFMISFALLGIITNLAPLLTDAGLSMPRAAALLGVVGGSSWFSRIGLGALLDRVHVKYLAMAIFVMIAAGTALVGCQVSGPALVAAAVMIGLGMGSEADLVGYSASRYYSGAALSRALGGIWVCWAWGGGLGVFAGSLSYDLTRSYAASLWLYVALALASGALILRLGPYRCGGEGGAPGMTSDLALAS